MRLIGMTLLCFTAGTLILPLAAQESPTRLTFDVAAIRPSKEATLNGGIKPEAGGQGYTAKNITVKLMISLMYKVPMRQITGGPAWLNDERFDVEARTDTPYNVDDLHTMFQNLLVDRFGLKFHKETKEGNVYALTIAPSGLKMKANDSAQDFRIPINGPPQHTVGVRVPMVHFCWWLGQNLQDDGRPVVNETGLTGNYDFALTFRPQLPPGAADNLPEEVRDLPSIFTALRDQLGLKLTAQKGPVEYYVIDDVQKPSEN
jgi:uncharacterized protein (TIGR03435 family)